MSFSYSNPYAQAQSSRPPITTTASSQHCQILFGGLPPDASEQDLRDLLISPMLALSEHSVSVKGLYSSIGKPLGMALVQVLNGVDAEKVRSHCSGQIIDATYRLTVQHVLPPTQPLPPQTVQSFVPIPKPVVVAPTQPKQQVPKGPKAINAPTKDNGKPPGLQLLQRMGKNGPPGAREKQAALLAHQKANLKLSASQPGKSLLNRLNKPTPAGKATSPIGNARSKGTPVSDKMARAKAKANSNSKMEVDEPLRKSKERSVPKAAPKTQADLDEEMRAYDRQRRFA